MSIVKEFRALYNNSELCTTMQSFAKLFRALCN